MQKKLLGRQCVRDFFVVINRESIVSNAYSYTPNKVNDLVNYFIHEYGFS